jgi:hypothetical protein
VSHPATVAVGLLHVPVGFLAAKHNSQFKAVVKRLKPSWAAVVYNQSANTRVRTKGLFLLISAAAQTLHGDYSALNAANEPIKTCVLIDLPCTVSSHVQCTPLAASNAVERFKSYNAASGCIHREDILYISCCAA